MSELSEYRVQLNSSIMYLQDKASLLSQEYVLTDDEKYLIEYGKVIKIIDQMKQFILDQEK